MSTKEERLEAGKKLIARGWKLGCLNPTYQAMSEEEAVRTFETRVLARWAKDEAEKEQSKGQNGMN